MKRLDYKEQLLDAGVAALHQHGFNGCGVQEITSAAGVPKGSFYNYFESKEAFSAAALERYWSQVARKNLEILSDESIPAVERLKAYFKQRAETHVAGNFERGCMIGNLASEISAQSRLVRDHLAGLFANWSRLVANCLRDAQRHGDIRTDLDAETLAGFIVNSWQGAVLRAKVDRDATSLELFEKVLFSTILVKDPSSGEKKKSTTPQLQAV